MAENPTYNIYHTTKEAWEAMLLAMQSATRSIYWEMYILVDDDAGKRFFEVLMEKAQQGVDVRIILDYWGSFWFSSKKIDELRKCGIDIRIFRPQRHPILHFREWVTRRTHRKILVVDEQIGFVGGVNVAKDMETWDDLVVEISGKAVRSLSRSFAKTYIMCGGDWQSVRHLLSYRYRVRKDVFDVVFDDIDRTSSRIRNKYLEAIYKARERVILFSPYYFPDKQFLHALWTARKRKVKVDLLIPFRTDVRLATYAAYAWFSVMKKLGVNIHLTKKMMHGKGVVVDDEFAFVGTSNLEHSSFKYNQEVNVQLRDKKTVARIKRVLEKWIGEADTLDHDRWGRRGWWARLKETIARKLYAFWFGVK